MRPLIERTISGVFEDSELTTIGDYAFLNCSQLTEVNAPNCTYIGEAAFAACTQLTNVSFPKCETLGIGAFCGCSNLLEARFPEVKEVYFGSSNMYSWPGYSAMFKGCDNLSVISFPKATLPSNEYNTYSLFVGPLSNLEKFIMPRCSRLDNYAFQSCMKLASLNIHDCTFIADGAFMNCSVLKSLYLPNCLYIVGNGAFAGCTQLSEIYMLSTSVASLSLANAYIQPFSTTNISNGAIYVRASLVDDYKQAYNWSKYGTYIVGLTDEQIEELDKEYNQIE